MSITPKHVHRGERASPAARGAWAGRGLLTLLFVVGAIIGCAAIGVPASACDLSDTTQPAFAPYSRLRDTTLRYHGPAEDQANLTEYRIGWFGPSDADDPLAGDLWWAANLALADEAQTRKTDAGRVSLPPASETGSEGTGHTLSLQTREKTPGGEAGEPAALPFRLVPCWSTDVWGSGVSQLARMVYDEEPLALIGSIDSAATHLAEQVVAKANLPLVSPIATDPTATLAGVSWMFSCAPSDAAIACVLVDALLGHLSDPAAPGTLVLLSTTDHESRMTTRDVLRELSRRGRLPDFRIDLATGAPDVASHLRRLADTPPAAIVVIAGSEDAARIVQATRAAFGSVPIFGGPSMSRTHFLERSGVAANGVTVPLLLNPADARSSTRDFIARFVAARGHPPDYTAVLTYDATRLLLAAIRRAGPNRARIRQALAELSPWAGLGGSIQFDGTGQNTRNVVHLGTVQDGAILPDQPRPGLIASATPPTAP